MPKPLWIVLERQCVDDEATFVDTDLMTQEFMYCREVYHHLGLS